MDWRVIFLLSFLFTSGFIQCSESNGAEQPGTGHSGTNANPYDNSADGKGSQQINSGFDQPIPSPPNSEYNERGRDAHARDYRIPQHTCVDSNQNYDCIFRHVFINGSNDVKSFGSYNAAFNNQTSLMFQGSTIRTFPRTLLDSFWNVETLNLEHLQIEKIERNALVNGQNIKQLHLSYNNIESLDIGVLNNLHLLEVFAFAGNKLSSIPIGLFNNAKNLTTLSLANNNLKRIEDNTFVYNTKLENINMTNNQLVHFSLSRIQNLFVVDVSHNKLEKLEIPSTVEDLDASHNEIKEVIGQKGNNLTNLMLSYNNLSTTAWLQRFEKIVTLDLSHNEIEDITSTDFKQLQRLTKLNLNNNRLFTFEIQNSEVMRSLNVLDLSHNELLYVESNYRQFQILQELYLDHNKIVSLKIEAPSKKYMNTKWAKLEKLTLSYNDWDCALMEKFLKTFPLTLDVDYHAETHCVHTKLTQGLCCKSVEMAYHDRLIEKIAEVTSYEKVARANGRCNAGLLTNSVQNVSTIVTQPGALPSSELERELQRLQTEVQRIGENFKEAESNVNSNINKIDALTRIYRVTKTGLVLPSDTLRKVLEHMQQRDRFKEQETVARYKDSEAKKKESNEMKTGNEWLQKQLDMIRNQTSSYMQEKAVVVKAIKKLEKEKNRNPDARRVSK